MLDSTLRKQSHQAMSVIKLSDHSHRVAPYTVITTDQTTRQAQRSSDDSEGSNRLDVID